MVRQLTSRSLEAELGRRGILVIDCRAAWCAACVRFGPVFDTVAGRFPQHRFYRLDVATEPKLIRMLRVEHVPTLFVFRDGLLLFRGSVSRKEESVTDIVRHIEGLDMSEVRDRMERDAQRARLLGLLADDWIHIENTKSNSTSERRRSNSG